MTGIIIPVLTLFREPMPANNMKNLFKEKSKEGGFTLIELIVVMAVFLFIIGAAIGIFLSIIQYQKKVLSEEEILNQISYVEEYMSKALRMAKVELNENCLKDSTSAQPTDNPGFIYLLTRKDALGMYKGIKFLNQSDIDSTTNDPVCQEFFLDTDGVLKEIKGDGSPVALSPADMKINYVKFSVNGSDGSASNCTDPVACGASGADNNQARVTILLNVSIPGDNQTAGTTRTIQTTVSQRNLNAK